MELWYMVETSPFHLDTDEEGNDAIRRVNYLYDLELDDELNIVGGEWYNNAHPDFLWVPLKGTSAVSYGDALVSLDSFWDGQKYLESRWSKAARQSAKYGMPLAKMVKSLIQLSQP